MRKGKGKGKENEKKKKKKVRVQAPERIYETNIWNHQAGDSEGVQV